MGWNKKKIEEVKPEVQEEPKTVEKKEEVKNQIVVVKELPTQQVRSSVDEKTGIKTTYITIEEALTSMMEGD